MTQQRRQQSGEPGAGSVGSTSTGGIYTSGTWHRGFEADDWTWQHHSGRVGASGSMWIGGQVAGSVPAWALPAGIGQVTEAWTVETMERERYCRMSLAGGRWTPHFLP